MTRTETRKAPIVVLVGDCLLAEIQTEVAKREGWEVRGTCRALVQVGWPQFEEMSIHQVEEVP